jgi:hypothetical protein
MTTAKEQIQNKNSEQSEICGGVHICRAYSAGGNHGEQVCNKLHII